MVSTAAEKLEEVQQQIKLGQAPTTTVRQLLELFGYTRRGRWVVRDICQALHNAGLHTDPDFEYAWIDGTIKFVGSSAVAEGNGRAAQSETPTPEITIEERTETGAAAVEPLSISKAYADPTYRIGKLPAANRPPVCVHPDGSVTEALTIMMLNDYSQLPVMPNERDVRGMISWKSMAVRSELVARCEHVRDCMSEPAEIVSDDTSLFRVINLVVQQECVLVRDRTKKISGIVTAADLSETFHQLGRPFLLLGEIENLIRGLIDGKFSADELKQVRSPADGDRQVEDVSDLTFGEYVRLLQEPDRWDHLDLGIDRVTFIKDLEAVNRIRNDVMHFDPDGISGEDLEELRMTAKFLQELRAVRESG